MADSIPGNVIFCLDVFNNAEIAVAGTDPMDPSVKAVEGVGNLMVELSFGLCGYEDVPRE